MTELDLLFYILGTLSVLGGLGVVLTKSPINSVLYLVMTMLAVAGLFFTLGAPFLAAVQIIVYAGAVLVLFVMVLMLFDLNREKKAFTRGLVSGGIKLAAAGAFIGLVVGAIVLSAQRLVPAELGEVAATVFSEDQTSGALKSGPDTKTIAKYLFTKYVFAFEVIGLLLLIVPIGVVALSRIAGGTHAHNDK